MPKLDNLTPRNNSASTWIAKATANMREKAKTPSAVNEMVVSNGVGTTRTGRKGSDHDSSSSYERRSHLSLSSSHQLTIHTVKTQETKSDLLREPEADLLQANEKFRTSPIKGTF